MTKYRYARWLGRRVRVVRDGVLKCGAIVENVDGRAGQLFAYDYELEYEKKPYQRVDAGPRTF
jgi:hypothetical protein